MSIVDIRELSIRISLIDENLSEKLLSINQIIETTKTHFQDVADIISEFEGRTVDLNVIPQMQLGEIGEVPEGITGEIEGVTVSRVAEEGEEIIRTPQGIFVATAPLVGAPEARTREPLMTEEMLTEQERVQRERIEEERQNAQEMIKELRELREVVRPTRTGERIVEQTAENIQETLQRTFELASEARRTIETEVDPEVKFGLMNVFEDVFKVLSAIQGFAQTQFQRLEVVPRPGEEPLGEFKELFAPLGSVIEALGAQIPEMIRGELVGLPGRVRSFESETGADITQLLEQIREQQSRRREAREELEQQEMEPVEEPTETLETIPAEIPGPTAGEETMEGMTVTNIERTENTVDINLNVGGNTIEIKVEAELNVEDVLTRVREMLEMNNVIVDENMEDKLAELATSLKNILGSEI